MFIDVNYYPLLDKVIVHKIESGATYDQNTEKFSMNRKIKYYMARKRTAMKTLVDIVTRKKIYKYL